MRLGRSLLMVCLLFCMLKAGGQEMLGIVNSNYSGSAGISMNPASIANSRIRFDIKLFTINSFLENNYFYLPANQASFLKIVSGSYRFPFFAKPFGEGERNVYSYYMDPSMKDIYLNTRVEGPSVLFGLNDHIFTVHSAFRVVSSTNRLPHDIANFSYYGMDFYPQHNVYYERENYAMASMAWWEIGVTYATVLARPFRTLWTAGITVNWLGGYSGAYIDARQTDYIAYNDSILNVNLLDAELGMSLPIDYRTDEVDLFEKLVRGNGFSTDIGITYQYRDKPYLRKYKGKFYQKKFESYLYKIGFSILDLGFVTFRKNAQMHSFDAVSNHHINVDHLEYNNIEDEIKTTSEIFYGDREASLRDRQFRLYLPLAASVQLDYNPSGPWFINGTLIAPLPLFRPMIQRRFVLALSPRYESRDFEISLPMVLYDFQYPRLGISVRLYGLTIGTDNMGGLLGYRDFTGYDFYVSYKINFSGIRKPFHSRRNPCWFN